VVPKPVSNTVLNIENALANVREQTILCVGDVMLDDFGGHMHKHSSDNPSGYSEYGILQQRKLRC
jgi:hypothetical protein